MTQENYKKATLILEQIDKLKVLNNRLLKDYTYYKVEKDKNIHLLETLELCRNVVDVLQEIDENKFKEL